MPTFTEDPATTGQPQDGRESLRRAFSEGKIFELSPGDLRTFVREKDQRFTQLSDKDLDSFLQERRQRRDPSMRGPVSRFTLDAASAEIQRQEKRAAEPSPVKPPPQYGRGTTYATGMGSAVGGAVPIKLPEDPLSPVGKLAKSYTADMPQQIVDPNAPGKELNPESKGIQRPARERAISMNAAYGTFKDAAEVAANTVEGLTTPTNVALLGGMALLPEASAMKILVDGGFAVDMARNSVAGLKAARDKWSDPAGDPVANKVEAGKMAAEAMTGIIFALGAGKGAKDNWTGHFVVENGKRTYKPGLRDKIRQETAKVDPSVPGANVHPDVEEAGTGARHYRDLERNLRVGMREPEPVKPPSSGIDLGDLAEEGRPAAKEYQAPPLLDRLEGEYARLRGPKALKDMQLGSHGMSLEAYHEKLAKAVSEETRKKLGGKSDAELESEKLIADLEDISREEEDRLANQEKQARGAGDTQRADSVREQIQKLHEEVDQRVSGIVDKMEKGWAKGRNVGEVRRTFADQFRLERIARLERDVEARFGKDGVEELRHQALGRGLGDEQYQKSLQDFLGVREREYESKYGKQSLDELRRLVNQSVRPERVTPPPSTGRAQEISQKSDIPSKVAPPEIAAAPPIDLGDLAQPEEPAAKPPTTPAASAPPPAVETKASATPSGKAPESPVAPETKAAKSETKQPASANVHAEKGFKFPLGETIAATDGAETSITIPDKASYPAQYAVAESDTLVPSHSGTTFQKNQPYRYVNERAYHSDKSAQKTVVDHSEAKQWHHYVNRDPNATSGPPQVLPDGQVLGGNGRTMELQRAYEMGWGDEYKRYLMEHAAEFGLDPAKIEAMNRPVLIRKILGGFEDPNVAISDLNKELGKGMSLVERGVSIARRLSPESVEKIGTALADSAENVTLRSLMESKPLIFRDTLLADGIIGEKDLKKFFTEDGALNDDGKTIIENAMLGRVIPDVDLLQGIRPELRGKLERLIPSLLELMPRNDLWNLVEPIRAIVSSKVRGLKLDDLFAQQNMFDEGFKETTKILAKLLDEEKPLDLVKRFRSFVADARRDVPEQEMLFGRPDPRRSFREAFGGKLQDAIKEGASIADIEEIAGFLDQIISPKEGELHQAELPPEQVDRLVAVAKKFIAQGSDTPAKLKAKWSEALGPERFAKLEPFLGQVTDRLRQEAKGEREVRKEEGKPSEPAKSSGDVAAESKPAAGERSGGKPAGDLQRGAGGQRGDRPGEPSGQPVLRSGAENRVITLNEAKLLPTDEQRVPRPANTPLLDFQRRGAALAIKALETHGGFLNADGAGAGKTPSNVAIAKYFLDKGHSVLIVSPAEVFKFKGPTGKQVPTGSYAKWLPEFGIEPTVYTGQVDKFEPGKLYLSAFYHFDTAPVDGNTILIADEAHAFKNVNISARSKTGLDQAGKAKAVLFATATPADRPQSIVYMDRIGITGGGRGEQAYKDIGLIKRNNPKTREHYWTVNPAVGVENARKNIYKLFDKLADEGRMVRRELTWEGIPVEIKQVDLGEEARDVTAMIEDELTDGRGMHTVSGKWRAVIMGHIRRAQETFKVDHAVSMAKEELNAGRSVVIFMHRINESAVRKPIRLPGGEKAWQTVYTSPGTAGLIKKALLKEGLKAEDIAEIHGNAEEGSSEAMERFQANKAHVIIATAESGGTGINLDDVQGTNPRTMIVVTAPFSGDMNVQMLGRINRMTTQSMSKIRYLFSGTDIDTHNINVVSRKMRTLKAVVTGGEIGKMDPGAILRGERPEADVKPSKVAPPPPPTTLSAPSSEGVKRVGKTVSPPKQEAGPPWQKIAVPAGKVINLPDMEAASRARVKLEERNPAIEARAVPKAGGGYELEYRAKQAKEGLYQDQGDSRREELTERWIKSGLSPTEYHDLSEIETVEQAEKRHERTIQEREQSSNKNHLQIAKGIARMIKADWEARMVRAMGEGSRANLHDIWSDITGEQKVQPELVVGPEKFTLDRLREGYKTARESGVAAKIEPDQFEGFLVLAGANAKRLGMSLDDYLQKYVAGVEFGWEGKPTLAERVAGGDSLEQRPARVKPPSLFGEEESGGQALPSRVTPPDAQMGLQIPGMEETLAGQEAMKDQITGQRLTAAQYAKKKTGSVEDSPLFRKPESMLFSPKGVIQWGEDGRAMIRIAKAGDVSTLVHEGFHLWRRDMVPEDSVIAEKWAGVQDGKWTRAAEERFARGGEKYLRDGVAPNEEMRTVFEKFGVWLRDIYRRLSGSPLAMKIPPEMRGVYDRLFTERPERVEPPGGRRSLTDIGRAAPESATADIHELLDRPKITSEQLATKGEAAELEKGIVAERAAVRDVKGKGLAKRLEDVHKAFDKMPLDEQLEWNYWMDERETPEGYKGSLKPEAPENDKVRTALLDLRKEIDWRWGLLKEMGLIRKDVEDRTSYWPRRYEQGGDWEGIEKWLLTQKGRRPLAPKPSSLKSRVLESMRAGVTELGMKPESYNPVDNALVTVAELDRFIAGQEIFKEMQDRGMARRFLTPAEAAKHAAQTGVKWVPIDDRIAKVRFYSTAEQAWAERGEYYAPEEAADIINNYVKSSLLNRPGAWGSLARGVRTLNNLRAMSSVAFSAFHGLLAVGVSSAQDFGLALQKGLEAAKHVSDDTAKASKMAGEAAEHAFMASVPFASVTGDFRRGQLGMESLIRAAGGEKEFTADQLNLLRGGTRVGVDTIYDQTFGKRFKKAAREVVEKHDWKAAGTAGLNAIPAALQVVSSPIMKHLIPKVKFGATMKLAAFEMEKLGPDATPEQIRTSLRRITDEVDNRYGQMVRDNMFFPRALSDGLALAFNYVDFNYGTIRTMYGDVVSAARERNWRQTIAGDVERLGKEKELSHRLAYLAGYAATTAVTSAVLQTLMTGQAPWASDTPFVDLVAPRTGGESPDGSPKRVLLPGYTRSYFQWAKPVADVLTAHPFDAVPDLGRALEGRLSGTVRLAESWLTNKTYAGEEMRNKDAPLLTQMRQFFGNFIKDSLPISVQLGEKSRREGETPGRVAARYAGFSPPPVELTRTPAEKFVMDKTQHAGGAPISEEAFEKRDHSSTLLQRLRNGAIREGDVWQEVRTDKISPKDAGTILKKFRDNPTTLDRAHSLGAKDFLRAYELANDGEKRKLRDILARRRPDSLFRNVPREEQMDLAKKIRAILAAPVPVAPPPTTRPSRVTVP